MRTRALLVVFVVGCSSTPSAPVSDASEDFAYYSGDGNLYAPNDAAPACQPVSTAGFSPAKITPLVNPVCTNAQVVGLVTQCFDPSLPDRTACTAWKADPNNEACLTTCPVATDIGASSWGPLVKTSNPGVIEFFDLGACVALMDPSPAGQACATALEGEMQCEHAACAPSCPLPATTTQAAIDAYQNCMFAADSSECASYVATAAKCASTIAPGALFCVDGSLQSGDPTSFDSAAEKLLTAQCGGADGGSPFISDAFPDDG